MLTMPYINHPTFNAILQYIVAVGTLASALSPLFTHAPRVYAGLQRLAAWGVDVSKAFGAKRIPGPDGPIPSSYPPPDDDKTPLPKPPRTPSNAGENETR